MSVLRRLGREDGFTLVEMAIVGVLSTVVLVALAAVLIGAQRTTHFTQGQSMSLDDARLTLQQVGRDIQNAQAQSIQWCAADGSCLKLLTYDPTDELRYYRYQVEEGELRRAESPVGEETFDAGQVIIGRLANDPDEPVFGCDLHTSLLRVNIHFRIQPTPQSSPSYELATSVRPRNFPATASCP